MRFSMNKRPLKFLAQATAAVLVAGLAAFGSTEQAQASPGDVVGASLDWGVKSSFNSYIGSGGVISVSGGASEAPSGFRWGTGSGSYNPETGEAQIAFSGTVSWSYADHGINVTLSNPTIALNGLGSGVLSASYSASDGSSGSGVIASLTGVQPNVSNNVATFSGVTAAAGPAASAAFGDYPEGTTLDALSFSLPFEPVAEPVIVEPPVAEPAAEPAVQPAAEPANPELAVPGPGASESTVPGAAPVDATPVESALGQPQIQVFAADGVTPIGDTKLNIGDQLVITGTGFDPASNVGGRGVPVPASLPQGSYVVFGSFLEQWQPSSGAASSSRKAGPQSWALTADTLGQVPAMYKSAVEKQWTELAPDGSFTATIKLEKLDALENGKYGIYTYAGGGQKNAAQELYVPINFSNSDTPVTPDPKPEPEPVVDGGLDWGFKASFRSYIDLFGGTVILSDGASRNADGTFHFQLGTGSSFDSGTNSGSINYRGSVLFNSPTHGFSIALKNPTVVMSPTAATLTADVSSSDIVGLSSTSRIAVATLAVPQGQPIGVQGKTWTDVAGTFVDTLSPAGWEQYRGQSTDSLSYSYGVTLTPKPAKIINPPAPATDAYVDPVVQPAAPSQTCVANSVSGATLSWGVKTSFYEYINSPVAAGQLIRNSTTGDGSTVVWSGGSGTISSNESFGRISFPGGATYTGHNGLLKVTISNPRIHITGANTATLVADMTSNNTAGVQIVAQSEVQLATLNLAAGSQSTTNGSLSWAGVPATLTNAGVKAFADFYPAGTAMDTVAFSLPLGTSVPCDVYSNPNSYKAGGVLAHTGSDSTGLGFLMAASLLGLGLLVIARRQTVAKRSAA